MTDPLTGPELVALVQRVFVPGPDDRALAVLVDLPDARVPDTEAWAERRALAAGWAAALAGSEHELGLAVHLFAYRNAGMNNADLPDEALPITPGEALPADAAELSGRAALPFARLFDEHTIVLAPTQFSATAPLKLAAREHGFRAATMPGFSAAMIPALRLDYGEINRRVDHMTALLDRASRAVMRFSIDGGDPVELVLDLRHRGGHASGGLFPRPGVAGNLPSGEAYIVPYEGERPGDASQSAGLLPVQLGDEVVVYEVRDNRAHAVRGDSAAAEAERARLQREPAYGNMAELGLGVLGDFGLEPTGELLLDEKLGLHIAFGRSDHFGGQVGAADFSAPDQVVHIDRVYRPSMQPRVAVVWADLVLPEGDTPLIRDQEYVVDFGARS